MNPPGPHSSNPFSSQPGSSSSGARPTHRRTRKDPGQGRAKPNVTPSSSSSTGGNEDKVPAPVHTGPKLDLLEYLLQVDRQYQYLFDKRVESDIIRACNQYLFAGDPSLLTLVEIPPSPRPVRPTIPPIFRDTDKAEYSSSDSDSGEDEGALGIEYSESRRGKPCGHVFFTGEGVYRCRNCSLDDTCVLCSRCFRASDHTGHDTSFSVNSGTGGCCDCGDSEAWRVPVNCKYHAVPSDAPLTQSKEFPPHCIPAMVTTIRTILDFMLGTFCTSKDPFKAGLDEASVQRDMEHANIPFQEASCPAAYSIVLWNDDAHSYQEVIDQLVDGIGVTPAKARVITDRTHACGRAVILTSPDLSHQIRVANYMASIKLQVSIRSARDTFREQLSATLLLWLKDLSKDSSEKYRVINHAYDGHFTSTIKTILCEELTSSWTLVDNNPKLRDFLLKRKRPRGFTEADVEAGSDSEVEYISDASDVSDEYIEPDDEEEDDDGDGEEEDEDEDGDYENVVYSGEEIADDDDDYFMEEDDSALASGKRTPTQTEKSDSEVQSISSDLLADSYRPLGTGLQPRTSDPLQFRLDWFLLYDMRLWQEVRAGLRELYMATLTLNIEYKKRIAISFATNYDRLSSSFLLRDKGPEHSIILFSVQLFTVPTITYTLAYEHKFLYTILRILRRFFTADTAKPLLRRGIISCETKAFRNRRYFHVFHDMRYITGTDTCTNAISGDTRFLKNYMKFLSLFQGMDPMLRQKGHHVEYEADTWINAFNVTLQLAKSCRQLASCYFNHTANLTHAIRSGMRLIYEFSQKFGEEYGGMNVLSKNPEKTNTSFVPNEFRPIGTIWHTAYRVLVYSVSDNYVSFHHPLHWFLAQLLHCLPKLSDSALAAEGWNSFYELMWTFQDPDWDHGNPDPSQSTPENVGKTGPSVRAMMNDFEHQRLLLSIFDYPLRVICMMAQIRSYLWVRNGHIAKSSAAHYCEITLRYNTYDLDVFLMQVALCLFDPDHIMLTILDRFELLNFFHGGFDPHPHESYDPSQHLHMVEQLLNLFIVCMSERANVAGLSLEEHTRRFIVHSTVTTIPYTDLMRQIPDRMNELPTYDQTIKDVANFKPPTSTNDIGYYQLKDEFLGEVDPYFIHYSRNRKAEAEQRLRQHALEQQALAHPREDHQTPASSDGAPGINTNAGQPKSVFAHTPLLTIETGPYQRLGNMLQGRLGTQIIFYALRLAVNSVGNSIFDTIIDNAIHLLYLAVQDKNNDFYRAEWDDPRYVIDLTTFMSEEGGEAAADGSPAFTPIYATGGIWHNVLELRFPIKMGQPGKYDMALLQLLFTILGRRECLHWTAKLEYILDLLHRRGSPAVRAAIRQHLARQAAQDANQSKARAEAEAKEKQETKRRTAREMKRKMMQSFVKAQK
ncbi:hypothetical protein BJ085DRAFT_39393, partial [Dimargaris cristalligena]